MSNHATGSPSPRVQPGTSGRSNDLSAVHARWAVLAATLVAAGLRFYGLSWGAPFFHFHIDEHFVFGPAELLRHSVRDAAMSPKFFMYSPLPMYALNALVWVYSAVVGPLVLTVQHDEVVYMVMGRAISAAVGTAAVPIAYLIGARVASRRAGAIAAFLLACTVVHLRESHFLTVDISATTFSALTLYFLVRIVQDADDTAANLGAGFALALGLLSKYSAAFLVPLVVLAHLLSDRRPRTIRPLNAWVRFAGMAAVPLAIAGITFLAIDPLVLRYYDKFRLDIREWVTNPLLGAWTPIWEAQFADVTPRTYWFTNLLFWGLGPFLELWALAGLVWLAFRRDRASWLLAAYPVTYYLIAGQTIAPFIRYTLPLTPALAVAAGVLSADGLRSVSWRRPAAVGTATTVLGTTLWAAAYMNVYSAPDSRLSASAWLMKNLPKDSKIIVEPSHNTPPVGQYLSNVDFYGDYVVWGEHGERHDYFHLYGLDLYRTLYNRGTTDEFRENYIKSRLALGDWIVMDDTFLQFYQHLPESDHAVVKQYYRDLFDGKLGFQLVKTFKVYPALFGLPINDDRAELTFRLFDHPRVFVFMRK